MELSQQALMIRTHNPRPIDCATLRHVTLDPPALLGHNASHDNIQLA